MFIFICLCVYLFIYIYIYITHATRQQYYIYNDIQWDNNI